MQPTDAGTSFYQEVERSFVGMDNLRQSAQQIRIFGIGRLCVAGTPAIVLSVLPHILVDYRRQYPNVMVSLEMRSESTVRRWTSSSYCDIGFATAAAETLGVNVETLYKFPALCALPANHPLARRKVVGVSELDGENLILPSHAEDTRATLDRALEQAGARHRDTVRRTYLPAGGARPGYRAREPIGRRANKQKGVAFRPLDTRILFEGYAVYPRLHDHNPIVMDFIRQTKARLPEASDFVHR